LGAASVDTGADIATLITIGTAGIFFLLLLLDLMPSKKVILKEE